MPYIAIKTLPKDKEMKILMAERINQTIMEVTGCKPEAVTISIEEVEREDWKEKVREAEIEPNMDKMMIVSGVRTDRMNG